MKLEELTKTQIVLLTLLVSFVTSIATGIVTVSLMDQAPAGVTQTINRVVERTIEKVVPSTTGNSKDSTVVVKEEDLTINSIEKNSKSLVRINNSDVYGTEKFYGLGIILSADGIVVSHKISDPYASYSGTFSDGKKYRLDLQRLSGKDGVNANLSFFRIIKDDKNKDQKFTPATLGDSEKLKLGQTVISLSGKDQNLVTVGIVSSLQKATPDSNATSTSSGLPVSIIETDTSPKDSASGGPLINLSGDVVGIRDIIYDSVSGVSSDNSFLPVNLIKKFLTQVPAESAI